MGSGPRPCPNRQSSALKALKGIDLDGQFPGKARLTCTYISKQKSAQVLASTPDGKPTLLLWRRPDKFKGAVLFDGVANAPKIYVEALGKTLNGLQKEQGIGIRLDGRSLHGILETKNLIAAATTSDYDDAKGIKMYKGMDLLTGELNPILGKGSGVAMIGKEFVGRYAASMSGLAILSEHPLGKIEKVKDGVRLQNTGRIRVASETGRVTITPDRGAPLPVVKAPNTWIILGTDEGIATLPVNSGALLTYYRCNRPVTITKN
jgi:hypothetical protein